MILSLYSSYCCTAVNRSISTPADKIFFIYGYKKLELQFARVWRFLECTLTFFFSLL